MRIVELDKKHELFRRGYRHAFRFDRRNLQTREIERILTKLYGPSYSWLTCRYWQSYQGRTAKGAPSRVCWIAVKEESIITQILLSIN
jgi:hypothetical protein